MIFTETKLPGAYIIDIEPREDERGFFSRVWCVNEFKAHNLNTNLLQCNIAYNHKKGILRGMHFQHQPYAEVKLVRCTKGAVFDVIIDLRQDSPTYKEWLGVELAEENHRMLYVPEGFAHGYLTLRDNSELFYQVTQVYSPDAEGGVRWDDPAFGVQWPATANLLISDKDQNWPLHEENA